LALPWQQHGKIDAIPKVVWVQRREFKAALRSFAVISTIGMTRS
jgi:hypothetical protein